jgi:formate hydrogenlyase subunit 4
MKTLQIVMVLYFYVLAFVMLVFVETALPNFRFQNFEKFGKSKTL